MSLVAGDPEDEDDSVDDPTEKDSSCATVSPSFSTSSRAWTKALSPEWANDFLEAPAIH